MTADEQSLIIERYNARVQELGETPQALGWRDAAQQNLRFKALLGIGDCSHTSVLDVGCGFGDFYGFLKRHNISDVRYSGTDLNPTLIDVARRSHPTGSFYVTPNLNSFEDGEVDYVFISGLFNFRIADNIAFMHQTVREAFRIARRGVAFNLLGSYVDFREPHLFYYSETEAFSFAKSLTRFVTLRSDYRLYEFAIYLYKEGKGAT